MDTHPQTEAELFEYGTTRSSIMPGFDFRPLTTLRFKEPMPPPSRSRMGLAAAVPRPSLLSDKRFSFLCSFCLSEPKDTASQWLGAAQVFPPRLQ